MIYAIDRLNRLLRHYGMSGVHLPAYSVDFHERLDALDRRAGMETGYRVMEPVIIVDIEAWPTQAVQVGARLALHENLIGAVEAPVHVPGRNAREIGNYMFWLGRGG